MKRLSLVIAFLAILVTTTIATPAQAWTQLACKRPHTTGQTTYVPWRWGSDIVNEPAWQSAFNSAVYDWNITPTLVLLVYDASQTKLVFDTYYADDNNLGVTNYSCNAFIPTQMDWAFAWGNKRYQIDDCHKHGVAGHETGHGLALGHSSAYALMNIDLDRCSVNAPQQDDVDGLNAIYP